MFTIKTERVYDRLLCVLKIMYTTTIGGKEFKLHRVVWVPEAASATEKCFNQAAVAFAEEEIRLREPSWCDAKGAIVPDRRPTAQHLHISPSPRPHR